jgi:hypothetical protein
MAAPPSAAVQDVRDLLTPQAVRAQAQAMLGLGEAGTLEHFTIDWSRLDPIVQRVLATMRVHHPDLERIPPHSRWRHFDVGGVDRWATLQARLGDVSAAEVLRARFDLVVTSVLLDAGAGAQWKYQEPGTGLLLGRSEGLAVASFHMFMAGGFSSAPDEAPLRADAAGLSAIDEAALARHFQVDADNPMVGLSGRVALLQRLGQVLAEQAAQDPPGGGTARVGRIADRLRQKAVAQQGLLPAAEVLGAVLADLGPIWPGRHSLAGVNLGDTWPHPLLGLVPLHKLSQWLTYSMLEPLTAAGIAVTDLDALTGLAEYRNGGLFVDGGLIVPKDPAILTSSHQVGSTVIVEWRSLTVALIDRVARELRQCLGLDAEQLPLAKVLEGGTWRAGREIAAELRPDAGPPLRVQSDGTVF